MAGDFSRWAAEVLGDEELAQGLRKLERIVQHGATPNREEVLAHLEDRYDLPSQQQKITGDCGLTRGN
jgi:hypothetical protein